MAFSSAIVFAMLLATMSLVHAHDLHESKDPVRALIEFQVGSTTALSLSAESCNYLQCGLLAVTCSAAAYQAYEQKNITILQTCLQGNENLICDCTNCLPAAEAQWIRNALQCPSTNDDCDTERVLEAYCQQQYMQGTLMASPTDKGVCEESVVLRGQRYGVATLPPCTICIADCAGVGRDSSKCKFYDGKSSPCGGTSASSSPVPNLTWSARFAQQARSICIASGGLSPSGGPVSEESVTNKVQTVLRAAQPKWSVGAHASIVIQCPVNGGHVGVKVSVVAGADASHWTVTGATETSERCLRVN